MGRQIPLLDGVAHTLVDDEDYEDAARYDWHLHTGGYAQRWLKGRRPVVAEYLHRRILGLGPGEGEVDHINGDKLDNRRANLRLATRSQNAQNMLRRPGASGHRNVYWHRSGNWRVQFCVDGKRISGGYFKDRQAAIEVADRLRAQLLPFAIRGLPDSVAPAIDPSMPATTQ